VPLVGFTNPSSILTAVLLPAPFGPQEGKHLARAAPEASDRQRRLLRRTPCADRLFRSHSRALGQNVIIPFVCNQSAPRARSAWVRGRLAPHHRVRRALGTRASPPASPHQARVLGCARASRPHHRISLSLVRARLAASPCQGAQFRQSAERPEPYRTDSAAARNASVDKPRPDRM
jgi:hypothetical protein